MEHWGSKVDHEWNVTGLRNKGGTWGNMKGVDEQRIILIYKSDLRLYI